ncbi:MAG: hypothetical protein KBD21_05475 [Candidatus Pacebacteria bacterium]|nr:hypothetical protein [Candidatus Paceibacterota bacterium]
MNTKAEAKSFIDELVRLVNFEVCQLAKVCILRGMPPSDLDLERVRERIEQFCVDTMRVDDPAFGLPKSAVCALLYAQSKSDASLLTPITTVRELVCVNSQALREYVGMDEAVLAMVRHALAQYHRALHGETIEGKCGGVCRT